MPLVGLILAAGRGSRFKSEIPKPVHPLLGKPMVYYPYRALKEGLDPLKVGVIVGYKHHFVRDVFRGYPDVEFFFQENPKGGTADAVLKSFSFLERYGEGFVAIINGDSPLVLPETLRAGFEKLKNQKLDGLIFTTVLENPTGYGRIARDERGRVKAIVEEKDATDGEKKIKEVNGGVYIFRIKPLLEALREVKPSPVSGELYLTEVVKIFYQRGLKIDTFQTDKEELLGVNDRVQFSEAEKILLRRKIGGLQREGVTVRLPETVYIEWDVKVGKDSEIEPHAVLKGDTTIGENCIIGTGVVLENCKISDRVRILPYSYLSDCDVKEGATVGPFARVRDNSLIGEEVEIGNFVEVKKSSIGPRAKAKHLTYIGDAQIGENTNIGAGTVFANYNGVKKYETKVGKNVFIGSNSLIIAPRTLKDWSFIAGGSVVNVDIPEGALAIGRAKLKILENKNPLLKRRDDEK